MTFSKRKVRQASEGPSRLQRYLSHLTSRFGLLPAGLIAAIKREARKRLKVEPRRKEPRGRFYSRYYHNGPGRAFKLRKRVVRLPGCPTDHSLDAQWHLNAFSVRERLGLPQNTPFEVVKAAFDKRLGRTA